MAYEPEDFPPLHLSEPLRRYVAQQTGPEGPHESEAAYLHHLVRQDYEAREAEKERRLHAVLEEAMNTPEEEYKELDIEAFLRQMHQEAEQEG